ncbi:MAG: hypothetical protein C4B59_02250 [Candidatus Methanogaster sp.]|uniref:Uncharacterized protein n=1 Tax=Candidatus Methanogaster sp. TaxID=3386292 RepID=A0AC61L5K8_9EURY|nr:MAG: hypothetical protein C4B59_02250 [ANME-2 cluster archaeon]
MKGRQRVPSWLETPLLSKIDPHIETRKQELPFGELTWEDFERLCLHLVRLGSNVEHCQLYGVCGQKQKGIDFYARKTSADKYSVIVKNLRFLTYSANIRAV